MLTQRFLKALSRGALLAIALAVCSPGFTLSEVRKFETEQQRERYQRFVDELRCPNCQSQNLAGSNSEVAADLRDEVYRLIMEGNSDAEIVEFMVARYGDYILYRPQFKSTTYALWLGPLVILFIGAAVAAAIVLKRRPQD